MLRSRSSVARITALPPSSGDPIGAHPTGDEDQLSIRIDQLQERSYLSLRGLEDAARTLAEDARRTGQRREELRARLVASDALSRSGDPLAALVEQLQVLAAAQPWPSLVGRTKMLLATTADRLGERVLSAGWIRSALADWPDAERPADRAEALMVFGLMTLSRDHADYELIDQAIEQVREHCRPLLLSVTLANFAEVAAECGQLIRSTDYADAAAAVLDRHPEVIAPLTLDSIARSRLAVGEVELAEYDLEIALDLERDLGCTDVNGDPWLTLAEVKLALGRPDAAWALMDHPRRHDWAAKSSWTRCRDLKLRADIQAAEGNWRSAYEFLTEHLKAYEELRSLESDRIVAENESQQRADEDRRRAAEFEQLALTDPLTLLANRRRVDRWLAAAAEPSTAPDHTIAIAIIDLDHFKHINDSYSHDAGDTVLRRVADALSDGLESSSSELLARLGGEEFVLLVDRPDAAAVTERVEALLARLRSLDLSDIGAGVRVTASAGVATGSARQSSTVLKAADDLLYQAKRAGRDRVLSAPDRPIEPRADDGSAAAS